MQWSCISLAWTSLFCNRCNEPYPILKNCATYMGSLGIGEAGYTFIQDGAPCCRAKFIQHLFGKSNLRILSGPHNFHDLNPIENVWSSLKTTVYSSSNSTVNVKKYIKINWKNSPRLKEIAAACIRSIHMPRRMVLCLIKRIKELGWYKICLPNSYKWGWWTDKNKTPCKA